MLKSFATFIVASAILLTAGCKPKPAVESAQATPAASTSASQDNPPRPEVSPPAVAQTVNTPLDASNLAGEAEKTGKEIDRSADEAFLKLGVFYEKLNAASVQADLVVEGTRSGEEFKTSTQLIFAAEKPNRFAIRRKGFAFGPDIVCDGTTQFTYLPTTNIYTETPAQADLEVSSYPSMSPMGPQFYDMFLLSLVAKNPAASLVSGTLSRKDLGTVELNGKQVRHLRCEQNRFSWEVWILEGDIPWVEQLSIDLSAIASSDLDDRFRQTLIFHDWTDQVAKADEVFAFKVPQGAAKNDSLLPFSMVRGGQQEEEISPLLGKTAPPATLPMLDEGDFDVASFQEKKVLMLDFWASWCGPCVMEMPVLAEVAAEFADRDVVLVCINQQEEAAVVREFLQSKKLNVPVALDAEGGVGTAYGVSGIPMLVLIDKKGIVQSVHVGYSPTLGATLRQELNQILEGKDLAAEALGVMVKRQRRLSEIEG